MTAQTAQKPSPCKQSSVFSSTSLSIVLTRNIDLTWMHDIAFQSLLRRAFACWGIYWEPLIVNGFNIKSLGGRSRVRDPRTRSLSSVSPWPWPCSVRRHSRRSEGLGRPIHRQGESRVVLLLGPSIDAVAVYYVHLKRSSQSYSACLKPPHQSFLIGTSSASSTAATLRSPLPPFVEFRIFAHLHSPWQMQLKLLNANSSCRQTSKLYMQRNRLKPQS